VIVRACQCVEEQFGPTKKEAKPATRCDDLSSRETNRLRETNEDRIRFFIFTKKRLDSTALHMHAACWSHDFSPAQLMVFVNANVVRASFASDVFFLLSWTLFSFTRTSRGTPPARTASDKLKSSEDGHHRGQFLEMKSFYGLIPKEVRSISSEL